MAKNESLTIRVKPEQKERWKAKAHDARMSLTKFVCLVVDEANVTTAVSVSTGSARSRRQRQPR